MGLTRTLTRSFSGGELSPEMYGRIDDAKYQAGAAKLQNFIATPQGPAENRPGFAYVNSTKNNGVARLIPFTFNVTQTMVIEMGAGYFRFHTDGATLQYPPSGSAWVAPSGAISISYTTPAIVTWNGHGLTTGDPIVFYLFGDHGLSELPSNFKVGYTYMADVIDANTFRILDTVRGHVGAIGLSSTGIGGTTNYPGSGTAAASGSASNGGVFDNFSSNLTGLASVAVPGSIATLNVALTSSLRIVDGTTSGTRTRTLTDGFQSVDDSGGGSGSPSDGAALYEYSTDGATWHTFHESDASETTSVSLTINVANISQLQLRAEVFGDAGVGGSSFVSASISTWSVDVPSSPPAGALTIVRAFKDYSASDTVAFGGVSYVALRDSAGGTVTPGTDATVWSLLPANLTYEIPNSYAVDDLFAIHYAQSADVLTLVHPNYPPAELRRLGATTWTFIPISAGPLLSAPTLVAAAASPGYLAQISATDAATPSKLTTAASHTLSLGDGVYATNLVIGGVTKSDFFLVSKVPVDGTGALIPNELYLMDYSGNPVTVSSLGSNPTIQFGGKIFDITNYYVVTALTADGINESKVSAEVSALDNLNVPGSYNTITWAEVTGASRYYVYKKKNGLYGYIGQTPGLSFNDNNIAPDFSITPPTYEVMFDAAGNYPSAVSYYDQRRVFGGTKNGPQDVWMTKTGTEADFSYSIPVKDTDRIYFRVASREANTIQHIVPLTQLLLLTNSAELRVSPVNSDAITPSDISVKPQSYVGASYVQPNIVNNSLVYAAARGGHVREMGYAWAANGFVTGDLSLRAAHLFDNLTILDQCYAKCPRPILWFVSSGGNLIGLTYIPEEQIGAWHHHSTDGFFESITAVAEGAEDRLYAVIRRTVNGQTVRYIERMASRIVDENDSSTWFFVDAGGTYNGPPETVISGLTWLEGKTVTVIADGAKQNDKIVVGGSITLDHAASVVHVGLPYTPEVETLPLVLQMDGFGQGRTKNINKVWVRTFQSSGVLAGPDEDHMQPNKQRSVEVYGTPPALQTDELEIVISPSWQQSGQVFIQGTPGLPLTVVGITMQVSVGG